MLDRNYEQNKYGGDQREVQEHPMQQWIEMSKRTNASENGKGNVENREFAVKQLEQQFRKVENMRDEDIQYVFNNVDEDIRKRLINTIVESYGFKGEVQMQDISGKMLTVELDNPPIQYEDERHGSNGWVIKYKAWENPQDKFSAPTKTNYISGMARYKANTPKYNSGNEYYKKAA